MYKITNINVDTRTMPHTKASKGGEKTIVTIEYVANAYPYYGMYRLAFHHDKVYIKHILYNRNNNGMQEVRVPFRKAHPFKFDWMFDAYGESLEEICLADMALKIYCGAYLHIRDNAKYLMKTN